MELFDAAMIAANACQGPVTVAVWNMAAFVEHLRAVGPIKITPAAAIPETFGGLALIEDKSLTDGTVEFRNLIGVAVRTVNLGKKEGEPK